MDQARFGWIYVMQRGPDGHLYILDSTNFAVRRLNIKTQLVETLVGTGKPGYSGDGGDAKEATLGGDPNEQFDGPHGLCVDELGNLFIDKFHLNIAYVPILAKIFPNAKYILALRHPCDVCLSCFMHSFDIYTKKSILI